MEDRELTWRKSSRSGDNGGNCVEVASLPGLVLVRDSKNRTGPVLEVTQSDWSVFVAELRR